jgi:non-ribosomal peptide synthetase component F
MGNAVSFDLSTVFRTVAEAIPDNEVMIWRDRRLTYAQMDARIDGVAHYLVSRGLGCHIERDRLAGGITQCGATANGALEQQGIVIHQAPRLRPRQTWREEPRV